MTKKILFLASMLFFSSSAQAKFQPPEPDGWVTDVAGVLTADTERQIEAQIEAFEAQTSQEIGILILPSLGGEPLEEVAFETFNQWGIGKPQENNGVLLVVSVAEAKAAGPHASNCDCVRIETGIGLESSLTDIVAGRLLRNHIGPMVLDGDYDLALTESVRLLTHVLSGDTSVVKDDDQSWKWLLILGLFFAIAVIAFLALTFRKKFSGGRSGGGGASY